MGFKLGNDEIPSIGYGIGTKWFKTSKELNHQISENLVKAINHGFTHIDTAEIYGNYPEFKNALNDIDRSKVFITDKFNPGIKDKDHRPYNVAKETLKYLNLNHFDLYLLHSPFFDESNGFTLEEAWNDLVKLKQEGFVKHIGVSNFGVKDLKRLSGVEVNQIEFSPFLQNQTPDVVDFSQKNGILVEAYSSQTPVIQSDKSPELTKYLEELAKKYNKTTGQINLRWVLDNGILPITTTDKAERLDQYLDVLNFKLTNEEVEKISKLGSSVHVRKYWTEQYGN